VSDFPFYITFAMAIINWISSGFQAKSTKEKG
jgi:hypothetical protein